MSDSEFIVKIIEIFISANNEDKSKILDFLKSESNEALHQD